MSVEYRILSCAEHGWAVVSLGQVVGYRRMFVDALELANAMAEHESEHDGHATKVVIDSEEHLESGWRFRDGPA